MSDIFGSTALGLADVIASSAETRPRIWHNSSPSMKGSATSRASLVNAEYARY
ncbi:hypothetical protein SAMN05216410_0723 [Sanguibacter gelidistatuariae]|uniref:Uncharacterized protein n=1 Tax=Sanguibacter gelidistatuariae TaxID=1814289 RepID=A0A1G6H4D3_9MICO|nr:hypothetical protein SAMN05216410_0723 [Sanguibacter gelidistatuariae]